MKQTQAFISTYTADVSGVCSALFELGGMVIMHDASGCNSTYHTHDEPRWYDFDSMVYISGLSEMEAIMGDDEKLIRDITDTAVKLHPKFIAIAGTPIPAIIGMDIPAVARKVEKMTGIPAFGFQTNGMHSYQMGVGAAYEALARRFVKDAKDRKDKYGKKIKINILGATPLDFSINGSVSTMRREFINRGFEVVSVWTMGSSLEEISSTSDADVNLVVSYSAASAARALKEKFRIPYVVGAPFGKAFTDEIAEALRWAVKTKENKVVYRPESSPDKVREGSKTEDTDTVIIGESVTASSLAAAMKLEKQIEAAVLCTLETEREFLPKSGVSLEGEDDIRKFIADKKIIIADPLYKPICPKGCVFHGLAHEAFSGRIYRKSIPNFVGITDLVTDRIKKL